MHIQICVNPWSVTWRNRRHHRLLCPSRSLSLLSSQLHTYVCVFPLLTHDPENRAHLSPCVAPQHLAQGDWSGMFAVRPMWAPEVQEVWGHRCGRYSPHLHKPPASSGRRGHSRTFSHMNMHRHPPTHALQYICPARDLALSESGTQFGPETKAASAKLAQRLAPGSLAF